MLSMMAIGLFLVVGGGIDSCSRKKTEAIVAEVNASTDRQRLIDSISNVYSERTIAAIDSLNVENDKKLSELKQKNKTNKKDLEAKVDVYNLDTTAQSAPCDGIIESARVAIDNLEEEVRVISNINKNLSLKIEVQDSELSRAKTSLSLAYSNNEKLQRIIEEKTNWWSRNEKKVYFVAGFSAALVIIKVAGSALK